MKNLNIHRKISIKKEKEISNNQKHYNLYFSPHYIRVIKSKKMTGAGHVAHIMI
jgi:hypothetical protein